MHVVDPNLPVKPKGQKAWFRDHPRHPPIIPLSPHDKLYGVTVGFPLFFSFQTST
jgi:hypothetical protein